MKGVCPDCGYSAELLGFTTDAEARACLETLLRLPAPLPPLVMRYLGLHRTPQRVLAWGRAARLVEELSEWLASGRLIRKGRPWQVTTPSLAQAIDEILARRQSGGLRLPLKGNGYLAEILLGLADQTEAQAERATAERLRGATPVAAHPSHKLYVGSLDRGEAPLPPPVGEPPPDTGPGQASAVRGAEQGPVADGMRPPVGGQSPLTASRPTEGRIPAAARPEPSSASRGSDRSDAPRTTTGRLDKTALRIALGKIKDAL